MQYVEVIGSEREAMMLEKIRQELISQALRRFPRIYPCGDRRRIRDCFTTVGSRLVFWFNTDDHSTHCEISDVLWQQTSVEFGSREHS